jgi:hypothetical protein
LFIESSFAAADVDQASRRAHLDRGAEAVLGMPPRTFEKRFGLPAFWKRLARSSPGRGS